MKDTITIYLGNGKYSEMTREEFDRFYLGVDKEASFDALADMSEYLEFEEIVEDE
jgi:hypothetical protein